MRVRVQDVKHVATCMGFGPRFLHSTGQAYKGDRIPVSFFRSPARMPSTCRYRASITRSGSSKQRRPAEIFRCWWNRADSCYGCIWGPTSGQGWSD